MPLIIAGDCDCRRFDAEGISDSNGSGRVRAEVKAALQLTEGFNICENSTVIFQTSVRTHWLPEATIKTAAVGSVSRKINGSIGGLA